MLYKQCSFFLSLTKYRWKENVGIVQLFSTIV